MNKIWFKRLGAVSLIMLDILTAISMAAVIYMHFFTGGREEQLRLLEGYAAEGDYLSMAANLNHYSGSRDGLEQYEELVKGYEYYRSSRFWQKAYETEGKEEYLEKQKACEVALKQLTEEAKFSENVSRLQSFH